MKKIILVLSILLSTILQAQGANQTSNYNVTVKDLYGNYNKFKVEIEDNSPQQPDYSMSDLLLDWTESLTETSNYNANNELVSRIRYLEYELRNAMNIINNQSKQINTLKINSQSYETLAENEIEVLKMQIESGEKLNKIFTFPDEYIPIYLAARFDSKQIFPEKGDNFLIIGMKGYGLQERWRKIIYKNQEYFVLQRNLDFFINK